jgi:hypothetical protein
MRTRSSWAKALLAMCFVLASARLAQARGAFQDMNFESAQVIFNSYPAYPNFTIATTNALPSWAAFASGIGPGGIIRTQQLTYVYYGLVPLGSPTNLPPVALGPASGGTTTRVSIDGNFDVFLNTGFISQTGQVPADAQALLFKVHSYELGGSVLASLDGQSLPLSLLLTVPDTSQRIGYTLYGANISSFAGQTADLVFSGAGGGALLDDIQFSTEPIPEPSCVVLAYLGSGIFFYVRKRKRRLP